MVIKKELTKEERIKKEFNRVNKIIKEEMTESRFKALQPLAQRVAFLRISIEDMEQDLLLNGFVELFTQSPTTPPYERERPTAKQYSTSLKNYQSLCKQLTDNFEQKTNAGLIDDGFESFLEGR